MQLCNEVRLAAVAVAVTVDVVAAVPPIAAAAATLKLCLGCYFYFAGFALFFVRCFGFGLFVLRFLHAFFAFTFFTYSHSDSHSFAVLPSF